MCSKKIVAVLMAAVFVAAGCGGGSGGDAASGPLVLTVAQLEQTVPSADAVAELMGVEMVDVADGSFFMMLIGDELPPGTAVEAHDYWSLDSGSRTMGDGAVDFASVIMLLLAEEPDVVPLFDQITNAEPEYTRWVPITVRGAAVGVQAVGIPYEGEPDDEPEFDAILARRDTLIVAATVSGADADARVGTAMALVELVFERAGEVSKDGDVSARSGGGGDPFAEAFADQLALDSRNAAFLALDRADTECFAATALGAISDQRLLELGFTLDNIPLLFEADWTDAEIDALTQILDTCVDDTATGTEAYLLSVIPQSGRYVDCVVPEITTTLGERYWLEAFRSRFTPPRIEMILVEAQRQAELAGEESPRLPIWYTDLEPIFETCEVPGLSGSGDDSYAEDACGGDPCEDAPSPGDLRRVVAQCSRDPYVSQDFYAGVDGLGDFLPHLGTTCQSQGRGTLIALQLLAYPCPQGPRDIEIGATGAPITEGTVTDACT